MKIIKEHDPKEYKYGVYVTDVDNEFELRYKSNDLDKAIKKFNSYVDLHNNTRRVQLVENEA